MTSNEDDSIETKHAPRAIVAGHGSLPQGLVNAVDCISGRGSDFLVISNFGLTGSDIEDKLRVAASEFDVRVFFTDLPGGSATIAVRRMMRTDPNLVLVTGANLSTLLEFVFQSDVDPAEGARTAAEKGRGTLVAFGDAAPKPTPASGDG